MATQLALFKWIYLHGCIWKGGKKDHGEYLELFLDGETPPRKILEQLVSHGVDINQFEVSTPSLNEIFIRVVGEEG